MVEGTGLKAGDTVVFELTRDGYEITCKNCGEKAVKATKNGKYCDDRCRYEYHEKLKKQAHEKAKD